jgi:hypothetical protein
MYRNSPFLLIILLSNLVVPIFINTPIANAQVNNAESMGVSVTLIEDGISQYVRTFYFYDNFSHVSHYLQVSAGTRYNVTGFPEHWSFEYISPEPSALNIDANSWINFTGDTNTVYMICWIANEMYQPVGWKDDSFRNEWISEKTGPGLVSSSFTSNGDIANITVSGQATETFKYYKKKIPNTKVNDYNFLIFQLSGTRGAQWFLALQNEDQHDIYSVTTDWQNFPSTMMAYAYDLSSVTENIAYVSIGVKTSNGSVQSGFFDYIMFSRFYPQPARPCVTQTAGNGGFETGTTDEWILGGGNSSIVSDVVYGGKYALMLSTNTTDKFVGTGPRVNVSRVDGTYVESEYTTYSCFSSSDVFYTLNLTGYMNYKITGYPMHWSFEDVTVNDVQSSPDDDYDANFAVIKSGVNPKDVVKFTWRSNDLYESVGWRDDSFRKGWLEFPAGTQPSNETDGDIITLAVPLGQDVAYMERMGLDVDLNEYKFILIRYKYSSGQLFLSLGKTGEVQTILHTLLPSSSDFTTHIIDMQDSADKKFNHMWLHKYGEETTASIDFIMFARSTNRSTFLHKPSWYIHPLSRIKSGCFSVCIVSGEAEVTLSAESKTLHYVFSSKSPISIEENATSKIAVKVITQNKWCSLYVNPALDWQNAFDTILPEPCNLTIRLLSRLPTDIVYFDEFDFWGCMVTITVYGLCLQPIVEAEVSLLHSDNVAFTEGITDRYGAVIFYQMPQGNYTLKLKYRDVDYMKAISVSMDSFYVISLDIYFEIFGATFNKMQTIVLVIIGITIIIASIMLALNRRKRKYRSLSQAVTL